MAFQITEGHISSLRLKMSLRIEANIDIFLCLSQIHDSTFLENDHVLPFRIAPRAVKHILMGSKAQVNTSFISSTNA